MRVLFWLCGGFDRRTPSEHLLTAVIEALYKKGHTVHVIQKGTGGPLPKLPDKLAALGVTTQCVSVTPPKKSNLIARYVADMRYVSACRRLVRRKDGYGAVFMQSTNVAGFALKMLKKRLPHVPITYNVQDIFPYNAAFSGKLSQRGIPFRLLAGVQRYAYRHATHIITISEDMCELLVEDGVPREKIACVYNWSYRDEPYSTDELDCTVARRMLPADTFNVVYAGNIGVMQNADILVRAAEIMKDETDVHFHIIGDGAYKERLQRQAEEAGLSNLSFWPMQKSELAPSLYATADVNVIPLVKGVYKTALPSKTATCLACKRPIVFCIGQDSRFAQRVRERIGCPCIDSDDAAGLAEAIRRLRQSPTADGYGDLFTAEFSITANSARYAALITGGCDAQ